MYCAKFGWLLRENWDENQSRRLTVRTSAVRGSRSIPGLALQVSSEIYVIAFVGPFWVWNEHPARTKILSGCCLSSSRMFCDFDGRCTYPGEDSAGGYGSRASDRHGFEHSNRTRNRPKSGGYIPSGRHRKTGNPQCNRPDNF